MCIMCQPSSILLANHHARAQHAQPRRQEQIGLLGEVRVPLSQLLTSVSLEREPGGEVEQFPAERADLLG